MFFLVFVAIDVQTLWTTAGDGQSSRHGDGQSGRHLAADTLHPHIYVCNILDKFGHPSITTLREKIAVSTETCIHDETPGYVATTRALVVVMWGANSVKLKHAFRFLLCPHSKYVNSCPYVCANSCVPVLMLPQSPTSFQTHVP